VIEVRLYGQLKKLFFPSASMSENTILELESIAEETFVNLLDRLDLKEDDCGDCFVNGKIAESGTIITDGSRVALFPLGMHLLCGGQHLKGHGFITKKVDRTVFPDYFDRRD